MPHAALRWVLRLGLLGVAATGLAEGEMARQAVKPERLEKATFAGGCFWCMQPPYDTLEGVRSTTVGYTGGHTPHPTYEQVCTGATGHAEAVEILFDAEAVSYERLLEVFWRSVDPTTKDRQFADAGTQYRTAIFYHSEEQRALAEASKERLARSGRFTGSIVTEIVPASTFYPAEAYHQQYYKTCPIPYQRYRVGSGRETFLKRVWGEADGGHP